eukprot:766899-Hanusia_phi.AAC.8
MAYIIERLLAVGEFGSGTPGSPAIRGTGPQGLRTPAACGPIRSAQSAVRRTRDPAARRWNHDWE